MAILPLRLDILPPEQREVWNDLGQIPRHFVLYGGTAIALRLGHRQSVDFDFFIDQPIDPMAFQAALPFLQGAVVTQTAANTVSYSLSRFGWTQPVKFSFFGGLTGGRVGVPDRAGNGLQIASLLDLAAHKLKVLLVRAEKKDLLDLDAIFRSGISVNDAAGALMAITGGAYDPAHSVKGLAYFGDGDLNELPLDVKGRLTAAANRFSGPSAISLQSETLALAHPHSA
jgi:hypothetical protein